MAKPLSEADRAYVIGHALHHYANDHMRRMILAAADRATAIEFVRRALNQGCSLSRNGAGERIDIWGLGQGKGLKVTVGDREGFVRWAEIADAVLPTGQMALF